MSAPSPNRRLPATASGYELREQIGQGTCAAVYRAWCEEINDEVAIKVVELEWLQASLEDIGREIQVMSLSSHPNVVPFSTAFVQAADLWIVMPLLTGGSVLSLMNCASAFRDGLPEDYAIYVLWSVLKALEYFHGNGQMHRDVKAANLMLDSQGNTMLSDYGMMGWMVEGGWDRKQRQTFVGTPCWMAPEVMEQASGYDYKADVWSLGITSIELAQGKAPYTNYPPMKVLFLTLQNPPPTITGDAAHRFSEKYHDFVAACLQKDPKKRSSVKQLLKHPLFAGGVKKPEGLVGTIAQLPPIGSRGGSQKQLFRQLQKVAAPQRSGIFELSSRGLGWDFGELEEGQKPPESSVTQDKASYSASHGSPTESSPKSETSREPCSLVNGSETTSADSQGARKMASASIGNSSHPEVSRPANVSVHTVPSSEFPRTSSNVSTISTGSGPQGNNPSFSGEYVDPSRGTPQSSAHPAGTVPAKTVGLLKKGRFTVSDVTNPDKLDGKIDSFLDEPSDRPPGNIVSPKDDSFSTPMIPPSTLQHSVNEVIANTGRIQHAIQPSSVQPLSVLSGTPPPGTNPPHGVTVGKPPPPPNQPQIVTVTSSPTYSTPTAVMPSTPSGQSGIAGNSSALLTNHPHRAVRGDAAPPSYAQVVNNTTDRSFTSGVAPVVINVDSNSTYSAAPRGHSEPFRSTPLVSVPPIPIHSVQATKGIPQVSSAALTSSLRHVQESTQASTPTAPPQHASPVQQTQMHTVQGNAAHVPAQPTMSAPTRSPPSSSVYLQNAGVQPMAPGVNVSSTMQSSAPSGGFAGYQNGPAPIPPKRKSRFEVKDVQSAPAKQVSVLSTTQASAMGTNGLSNAPPAVPTTGPVVPKPKSRFEVKDVDQRQRPSGLPNGSPSIVNISPSSAATSVNNSRQTTPHVSPLPESAMPPTQSIAKQSFSLLTELSHTIQALVQENEALRRELAFLKGKSGAGGAAAANSGLSRVRSAPVNEGGPKGNMNPGASGAGGVAHPHNVNAMAVPSGGNSQLPPTHNGQGQAQSHGQLHKNGQGKLQNQGQTVGKVGTFAQASGHVQGAGQVGAISQAHMQTIGQVNSQGGNPSQSQPLLQTPTAIQRVQGVKHSASFPAVEGSAVGALQHRGNQMSSSPNKVSGIMQSSDQERIHGGMNVGRMEQNMVASGSQYGIPGMGSSHGGQVQHGMGSQVTLVQAGSSVSGVHNHSNIPVVKVNNLSNSGGLGTMHERSVGCGSGVGKVSGQQHATIPRGS